MQTVAYRASPSRLPLAWFPAASGSSWGRGQKFLWTKVSAKFTRNPASWLSRSQVLLENRRGEGKTKKQIKPSPGSLFPDSSLVHSLECSPTYWVAMLLSWLVQRFAGASISPGYSLLLCCRSKWLDILVMQGLSPMTWLQTFHLSHHMM